MRQEQRPWVKFEFEFSGVQRADTFIVMVNCYVVNLGVRPAMVGKCEFSKIVGMDEHNKFPEKARNEAKKFESYEAKVGHIMLWPLYPSERVLMRQISVSSEDFGLLEISGIMGYCETTGGKWFYNISAREFDFGLRNHRSEIGDCTSIDDFHFAALDRDGTTHIVS